MRLIDATSDDLRRLIRQEVETLAAPDGRTSAAHHPDPHDYLSQGELLSTYGISKATAQRWRDAGLPHSKIGALLFYRRADVRAWIERHRVAADRQRAA